MNITNFKRLRINDSSNFIDVESCGGHSSCGVILTAYDFSSKRIEIRRKERQTAMFVLEYSDIQIPEYWQDAEVIFSKEVPADE
jgi:hypothetical protein